MDRTDFRGGLLVVVITVILIAGCNTGQEHNISCTGREPVIEPDYSGVKIPFNIAPMNFRILENARFFRIIATGSKGTKFTLTSPNGVVSFPRRMWKRLLIESRGAKIQIDILSEDREHKVQKFAPFYMDVAEEPIDPYLCYRLLYPGYESWSEMKIVQRSVSDFTEIPVIENQLVEHNCINCHSFDRQNPERFMIHVRGSKGGTYFVDDDKVTRRDLRTPEMAANAVYPSWHPSGRYVVFSSNKIIQAIHMRPEANNEFYDVFSSLVIYDIEKNEMKGCGETDTTKYMETFPCWSPDGKMVYYCRTKQITDGSDLRQIKYDIACKPFDPIKGLFGKSEVVFNAGEINKSAALPEVSPDGCYLIFTLQDYGTFPVWHKEADLYLLDLKSKQVSRMSLNSMETESYHRWSSNGRWVVFSSKRGDGLTSRPYFAYFGSSGNIGKPFVLPQKDPTLYKRMVNTFNRPEFLTGRIKVSPRDFERSSKKEPIKAVWSDKER